MRSILSIAFIACLLTGCTEQVPGNDNGYHTRNHDAYYRRPFQGDEYERYCPPKEHAKGRCH